MSGSNGVTRVARNVGWSTAGQLATWSLAFVLAVVLPRYLGPEGVGEIYFAQALWLIAMSIATFGTDSLITSKVAADHASAGGVAEAAVVVRSLLLIVVWPLGAAVLWLHRSSDDVFTLGLVLGLAAAFTLIGNIWRSVVHGEEGLRQIALVDVVAKLALVFGVMVLLSVEASVGVLGLAWVPPATISAVCFFMLGRRRVSSDGDRRSTIRQTMRSGWPFFATTGTVLIYHQVDVVVISLLSSSESTGWYGAADQLYTSIFFVPTVVLAAVAPVMFRLAGRSVHEVDRALGDGLGLMLLAAVPIGFGLMVVGDDLTILTFGSDFAPSGDVLRLLGLAVVPTYAATFLGQAALALGQPISWARIMVGATIATASIDVAIVPLAQRWFDNGAIGGAVSYVVVETAIVIVGIRRVRPSLVNRPAMLSLAKLIAAGVVMAVVTLLVSSWPLAVRVPVAAVVFVTAVVLLDAIPVTQRQLIAGAAPKHPVVQRLILGPLRPMPDSPAQPDSTKEEPTDVTR